MRQKEGRGAREAGYTILEILVVLGIIALLAAVVAPRVVGYLSKAKSQSAGLQIKNLKSAVELYYVDTGRYPSEQEGLRALVDAPAGLASWGGPYLEAEEGLTDPWGRDYLYRAPGKDGKPFQIISFGRDGAEGGSGEDADLSS